MDKTFEDIITETLDELSSEENDDMNNLDTDDTTEPETDENIDDDLDDESEEPEIDDQDEDDEENTSVEENDNVDDDLEEEKEEVDPVLSTNQKDANAFAKLRTENKQYKQVIDFFDSRAKAMGLEGIDDLIAKTQEAELVKEAKKANVPVEYARKLKELEDKVNLQEQEKLQQLELAKEIRIKNSLDSFVQANNLDEKTVNKLAKDLITDGITFEFLATVPTNTIPRILKSYLPNNISKQKELEKKEKIKKEVPLSSKSNTSTNTKEDEIDVLAKMLIQRP